MIVRRIPWELWRWDNEIDHAKSIEQFKNVGLDIETLKLEILNPDADLELPFIYQF